MVWHYILGAYGVLMVEGSASVGHVFHAVWVRTCHAALGTAWRHGARWCVRGRFLTKRYFVVLTGYSHGSSAHHEYKLISFRGSIEGTRRALQGSLGGRGSVDGLVWHCRVLTGYCTALTPLVYRTVRLVQDVPHGVLSGTPRPDSGTRGAAHRTSCAVHGRVGHT